MPEIADATFTCDVCGKEHVWDESKAGQTQGCDCGVLMDVPIDLPGQSPSVDDAGDDAGGIDSTWRPGQPIAPVAGPASSLQDNHGGVPLTSAAHAQASTAHANAPSMAGAVLGGLLGAVVGGGLWGLIAVLTGYELGFVAIGVGFLAGVGAAVAAQGGGAMVGSCAAAMALGGLLVGKFIIMQWIVMPDMTAFLQEDYESVTAWQLTREAERHDMTRFLEERDAHATIALAHGLLVAILTEDLQPPADMEEDMDTLYTLVDDRWVEMETDIELDPAAAEVYDEQLEKQGKAYAKAVTARMSLPARLGATVGLYDLLWIFLAFGTAFRTAHSATVKPKAQPVA